MRQSDDLENHMVLNTADAPWNRPDDDEPALSPEEQLLERVENLENDGRKGARRIGELECALAQIYTIATLPIHTAGSAPCKLGAISAIAKARRTWASDEKMIAHVTGACAEAAAEAAKRAD